MIFPTAFERFKGVTFGTAIGDSLGYICEFNKAVQPVSDLSKGMLFSDDTQMYMATCLGLLDAGMTDDIDTNGNAVAKRYAEWSASPENNRAPGGACMYGCHRLVAGVPWTQSGKPMAGGCGTAMRSMAYGQRFWGDEGKASKMAATHALMTHRHAMAQAAAATVAAGVAVLKEDSLDMKDRVARAMISAAHEWDEETTYMLQKAVTEARSQISPSVILDRWRGWAGHEAVAASLFCFMRYDNFAEAVLTAVNSPGDSDSLGAITGALAGGFYGTPGIPPDWILNVEDHDRLDSLNSRMWLEFISLQKT